MRPVLTIKSEGTGAYSEGSSLLAKSSQTFITGPRSKKSFCEGQDRGTLENLGPGTKKI